jgi:hypothetical protein
MLKRVSLFWGSRFLLKKILPELAIFLYMMGDIYISLLLVLDILFGGHDVHFLFFSR